MEELFKKRFESFEPAPPENMLNNILEKAKKGNTPKTSKKVLSKKILYTTVAAIAAIAIISLVTFSNSKKNDIPSNNKLTNTINTDKQVNLKTENIAVDTQNPTKNNLKSTPVKTKNNSSKLENRETTDDFQIIAERTSCTGSAFLRTDVDVTGSWSSNTSGINFEYSDSSQTTVYFNGEGTVIFTFELSDQSKSDTFALTFYKPADITYTMTPADCGETNGTIVFTTKNSENRFFDNFSGSYDISTSGNSVNINNVPSGALSLTFKDQFSCSYSQLFSVASNRIEGEISYNNTIVNKATLFTTNITNSDVSYQWDFGDNGVSTSKTPTHTYKREGTYNIKLIVKKAICTDTLRKSITITKAADDNNNNDNSNDDTNNDNNTNTSSVNKFIIPNVITPNGDGKNDIFKISYPDNIKEFHAYILNKSGVIIAKWDNPEGTWDGYYKGEIVPSNTYYYVIKGIYTDGTTFEFKKFIELYK